MATPTTFSARPCRSRPAIPAIPLAVPQGPAPLHSRGQPIRDSRLGAGPARAPTAGMKTSMPTKGGHNAIWFIPMQSSAKETASGCWRLSNSCTASFFGRVTWYGSHGSLRGSYCVLGLIPCRLAPPTHSVALPSAFAVPKLALQCLWFTSGSSPKARRPALSSEAAAL